MTCECYRSVNAFVVLTDALRLCSNVQVLRKRLPVYAPDALAQWWNEGVSGRGAVLNHVLTCARINLELLGKLGLVPRCV
jgi:hypothetical protein